MTALELMLFENHSIDDLLHDSSSALLEEFDSMRNRKKCKEFRGKGDRGKNRMKKWSHGWRIHFLYIHLSSSVPSSFFSQTCLIPFLCVSRFTFFLLLVVFFPFCFINSIRELTNIQRKRSCLPDTLRYSQSRWMRRRLRKKGVMERRHSFFLDHLVCRRKTRVKTIDRKLGIQKQTWKGRHTQSPPGILWYKVKKNCLCILHGIMHGNVISDYVCALQKCMSIHFISNFLCFSAYDSVFKASIAQVFWLQDLKGKAREWSYLSSVDDDEQKQEHRDNRIMTVKGETSRNKWVSSLTVTWKGSHRQETGSDDTHKWKGNEKKFGIKASRLWVHETQRIQTILQWDSIKLRVKREPMICICCLSMRWARL